VIGHQQRTAPVEGDVGRRIIRIDRRVHRIGEPEDLTPLLRKPMMPELNGVASVT
jgi:hypothetical protein